MGRIITLLVELLIQSNSTSTPVGVSEFVRNESLARKHILIWHTTMSCLRMTVGQSEKTCTVLENHEQKLVFAKTLT